MTFIDQWLRSDIRNINAYHVPSAKNMLKMDAMESPFGVPEELKDEFLEYISRSEVNRYPDASAEELQATLRNLMGIPKDFGVLLGNGSDELIQLLSLACSSGDSIMSFEPSFVMYELVSKFAQLNYHGIPLDENFDIDLNATLLAIKTKKPKLIFIAYPNNPTGNAFDYDVIREIIQSTDALVVLDEAYYAYSERSFLTEIDNFSNLVVLRTISKIGFAGLRLGLLVGSEETIEQLNKLRLPYNINILTQVSANFLLKDSQRIVSNDTSREHIFDSVDASLKNMSTDYLDLLLIHRQDPYMDHLETGKALDDLVLSGKVKEVGVSNFKPWDYRLLQSGMKSPLITNQIEMSLAATDAFTNGDLAFHQEEKTTVMAWSPLGGGKLMSNNGLLGKALAKIAANQNVDMAAVAVAWILAHPAKICPVMGTNNLDRIAKISDAMKVKMDRETWFELYTASFNDGVLPWRLP